MTINRPETKCMWYRFPTVCYETGRNNELNANMSNCGYSESSMLGFFAAK